MGDGPMTTLVSIHVKALITLGPRFLLTGGLDLGYVSPYLRYRIIVLQTLVS